MDSRLKCAQSLEMGYDAMTNTRKSASEIWDPEFFFSSFRRMIVEERREDDWLGRCAAAGAARLMSAKTLALQLCVNVARSPVPLSHATLISIMWPSPVRFSHAYDNAAQVQSRSHRGWFFHACVVRARLRLSRSTPRAQKDEAGVYSAHSVYSGGGASNRGRSSSTAWSGEGVEEERSILVFGMVKMLLPADGTTGAAVDFEGAEPKIARRSE